MVNPPFQKPADGVGQFHRALVAGDVLAVLHAHGLHLPGEVRVGERAVRDGVVEATGRLASPRRCAAFALRLERRPRRWAVTVLEAALAPDGRVAARS